MSESWFSRLRDRDSGWDEPTFAAPPAASPAEPHKPRARWLTIAARTLLGLLAVGWLALVGWSMIDPTVGLRLAPILEIIIRVSAPLLLMVGVGVLIMMLSGRWDGDGDKGKVADEVHEVAAQTAQAAARIADAHSQLLSQTKAYAAAADRSATALLDAVKTMSERNDQLAQSTGASVIALTNLGERMNAFDAAAPQIEARLAALTETLTRLSTELGERSGHVEARLKDAAAAAEDARGQLIEASQSLGDRLHGLREGAKAAGEELAGLSELSSARIDLTLDRVRTVLDTTEQRIEEQNKALARLVDQSQQSIGTASRISVERFQAHCSEIEETLDSLDARIVQQSEKSGAWLEAAASGVAMLAKQFDALERSAIGRTERLGTAMMELSGETRRLTDALEKGDQSSEQLIKRAEALLLALDSGIRELDESLPGAITRVEARLATMQQRIAEAGPGIEGVEAVAAAVVSRMEDSGKVVKDHGATLDEAMARSQAALSAQKAQVEALAAAIVKAGDGMARLGDKIGPQMVDQLVRVRETADAAAKRAREAIMEIIPQAAEQLGTASGSAVEKAVSATVNAQLEQLNEMTERAVRTAQGATDSLAGQLRALDESSDALERRMAATARQIDSHDRELLTRRSAELIEMLNSRAIDVAKWLSHDITQAEWSAYLKGDQGIFARRAVRMLSRADARAILELYRDDADFGEHVNRYVHDFEGLLKAVLEAKDGSALAVTMLSSDLGKLYVALAQAIERLKAN